MNSIRSFSILILSILLLTACNQGNESDMNSESAENNSGDSSILYEEGTYTGTAEGFNGPVKVEVTFSDLEITKVEVVEHVETEDIASGAIENIPSEIVKHQSLGVDTVSGATAASNAILEAVEDAVEQAGGDAETLKTVEVIREGVDEEYSSQIVVVGGGASGTSAALRAVELGAEVIVVEMTESPMGQATMAGGLFAVDSSQQIEQEKTVDPQWFYDQYLTTGNYMVNGGLLSKIINNSGQVVDWLEENGAEFTLAHPGTGGYFEHVQTHPNSTLHGYTNGGTASIVDLHQTIQDNGGTILYNTEATEIIMDGEKAAGIIAEKADGGTVTIHSDQVILATGGFGGNEDQVEETFGEGFGQSRVATNIGTGIELAKEAGGDADFDKAITMHYGLSRGGTSWGSVLNSALLNPYLHVDVDGNRFMNEEDFIFEPIKSANVIKSLPQRTAYELFDQTLIDTVKESGYAGITDIFANELADDPTKFIEVGHEVDTAERYEQSHTPTDLTEDIEKLVEEGAIIRAESPEEMAELLGMTNLVNTIERYNELCENGEDTDHFKSTEYLDNLEGTIYAVKITPSVFLGTLGGVEVNDNLQVIDEEGKAVEGLYAVGSDSSGVYSNTYVYFEGGTLGYAYGSGYIAGEHAANTVLNEN